MKYIAKKVVKFTAVKRKRVQMMMWNGYINTD